jgi:aminoglycoside phosphotransferase (APT) family kinase protein
MGDRSPTLLAGGYRNSVWRVPRGRGWVVEKRYSDDSIEPNPMFPNLPDHEAMAMSSLAGTGCAPELISFRPADGEGAAVVVYRYVVGTPWARGVADVARLLHRVHHAEPPAGMRRLHRSAAEALAHADEMVAGVGSRRERRRLERVRPQGVSAEPCGVVSLVHTDCGPGNLVRARHGLVLIDWQCPGLGDPVEDLACFLSPAIMSLYGRPAHSARSIGVFLDAYADPAAADRYRRDGAGWHYRIAAYCSWRLGRLRRRRPDVAERYRVALDHELQLLDRWVAR